MRESVVLPNCMIWPDLVLTSNQAGPVPAVPNEVILEKLSTSVRYSVPLAP